MFGVVVGEVVEPSVVFSFFFDGRGQFTVGGEFWIGTLLGEGVGCIIIEVEVVGVDVVIGVWDGLDGMSMTMGLEFEPSNGEWYW
jgi:hypothetical protein